MSAQFRVLSRFFLASSVFLTLASAQSTEPEESSAPKQISLEDFDKPLSQLAGLPRWFRLGGQYRGRLEDDTALSFVPGASDTYYLERFRLDMYILPTPWLTFKAEMQDSRNFFYGDRPLLANSYDPFDLREGYVEVGRSESNGFDVRVGRQQVPLGSKRLVAPGEWPNAGGPFDAVRSYYKMDGMKFEFFAGSPMLVDPNRFDTHIPGEHLYYTYEYFTKLIPNGNIEPYYMVRTQMNVKDERGDIANATLNTGGIRIYGLLPKRFDYTSETAWQWGWHSRDRVSALAGTHSVGWTVAPVGWKPRISVEFDHASGDKHYQDGKLQTFDSLYAGHGIYTNGLADRVGWRNIRTVRAGFEFLVSKRLALRTDFYEDYLATTQDGLYTSGGVLKVLNRNATSRHVGCESDIVATYQASANTQITAGFSRLFPSEYLKQSTAGSGYSAPYLMFAKNF